MRIIIALLLCTLVPVYASTLYAYFDELTVVNLTTHQSHSIGSKNSYLQLDGGVFTIDQSNNMLYLLVTNITDDNAFIQGVNLTDGTYTDATIINTSQPFDLNWNPQDNMIYIVGDQTPGLEIIRFDPVTKKQKTINTKSTVLWSDSPWLSAIIDNVYYIDGGYYSSPGYVYLNGFDLTTGKIIKKIPIFQYQISQGFIYNDTTIYGIGESAFYISGMPEKSIYKIDLLSNTVDTVCNFAEYNMIYNVGVTWDGTYGYALMSLQMFTTTNYPWYDIVQFDLNCNVKTSFKFCTNDCPMDLFTYET